MPATAAATLGSVALMLADIWSTPSLTHFVLHGAPNGAGSTLPGRMVRVGSRLTQSPTAAARRASLPPMPSVTRSVVGVSRSNCGLLTPSRMRLTRVTSCAAVMCAVVAPPQVASRKVATPSAAATCLG